MESEPYLTVIVRGCSTFLPLLVVAGGMGIAVFFSFFKNLLSVVHVIFGPCQRESINSQVYNKYIEKLHTEKTDVERKGC